MFVTQFSNRRYSPRLIPKNPAFRFSLILPLLSVGQCILSTACLANESHLIEKSLNAPKRPLLADDPSPKLQGTLWWKVAKRHQLDPYVLYAVALVESNKKGEQNRVTPWPWAINNAGKSFIPASQHEAETLLNKMLDEGKHNVDVGIMQVNLRWHGHRVAKPEHLLNPITNLEVGAVLLAEAIHSAPDNLALGVGRYYSWKNVPAAVEYGQKVIALADQIRLLI